MTFRSMLLAAASVWSLAGGGVAAQTEPEGVNQVEEVVVHAAPLGHTVSELSTSAAQLSGDELVRRRQATLGETLQGLPGVNSDTFGAGASRPVIRGQTAPRVKILSDSSELMDASAVSPDHAVVTEPLLLRRVEVLRGPSALLYGGGAISGAVNLVDSKIPTGAPARGVEGVAELRGGTNADERAAVFGLTVGGHGVALHAEGVLREMDDYKAPDQAEDRVHGTWNDTSTVSFGGSWYGDRGFLGAAFTRQRSDYGLPGHSHEYESCHPHGSSLHCGGHGHDHDDHDHDHEHDEEAAPFVKLRSDRWDFRGEYRDPAPGVERIRFRAGITDYAHDEVEDGVAATTFHNDGHDLRLEVEHRPVAGWRGVIGVQTAKSDFSALGAEAFLPATETRTTGVFIFEELEWNDWHFEVAARKDWQEIEGDRVAGAEHEPFSLSASVLWTFTPGYSVALAVSRSQRAPTAQELYARGVHLATNTYEIGSADLEEETANTLDLTFRKTSGRTTFTVGAFHHRMEDYVFADTLDRFEDFRLIRYTQHDARFTGIDGELRHEFTPQLSGTVFGDYVRAKLTGGDGNLPRIPAGRLGGRANGEWGRFSGELEYYRVFEQGKVAAFEAKTPGYDMLNATLAYAVPARDLDLQVYVRGANLLDELALNHASFVSRAAPLPGRTIVMGLRAAF